MSKKSYVLVVRDPDYANEITSDGDVVVVDIDLGSQFTNKPGDEETALGFVENLGSQLDAVPVESPVYRQALGTYRETVQDFPEAVAVVDAYAESRQAKS